jgi:hypothetical protein
MALGSRGAQAAEGERSAVAPRAVGERSGIPDTEFADLQQLWLPLFKAALRF